VFGGIYGGAAADFRSGRRGGLGAEEGGRSKSGERGRHQCLRAKASKSANVTA
jgi:hypothetical protein